MLVSQIDISIPMLRELLAVPRPAYGNSAIRISWLKFIIEVINAFKIYGQCPLDMC